MSNNGVVSVIIPTIGRVNDLVRTLESLASQTAAPDEVVVVDQSDERSAEAIVERFQETLNVKYLYSEEKSSSSARNIGIDNSRGDIVCLLDDDVYLDTRYLEGALRFFSNHPDALGVQGIITNFEEGYVKKMGGAKWRLALYNAIARVFLLNRAGKTNRFLPSARVVYCNSVSDVSSCQWLSGCCFYRRKVFSDLKCRYDETMTRYCYGEDKLLSYQIYTQFPRSLFVDPSLRYKHYPHLEGRLPTNRDLVKARILYNYYIWRKVVERTCKNRLFFLWSSIGDLILYFAKGWSWFAVGLGVYRDILFKPAEDVFEKHKHMFNSNVAHREETARVPVSVGTGECGRGGCL